jgi:phosphate transport system substrate-binding protein
MRNTLFAFVLLLAAFFTGCNPAGRGDRGSTGEARGQITISGAFALYPMTVKWAEEFRNLYPGIQIDISAGGAGKGMADALSGMVDLGMFSREVSPQEQKKGAWWIALTKDAVLPTIHAGNPFLGELKKKGVTRDKLIQLFVTGEITTWDELLDREPVTKVTLFTRSDACGAAAMWAAYLGVNQEDLKGLGVFGDPGVADAVKNDRLGLGYNNVAYVYDINSRDKYELMEVLPLDLNEDGKIDREEQFYGSLDMVVKAIKEGVYPAPPARELYFVANGKPEKEEVILFIEWILTSGQQFLNEAGYVQLSQERIDEELAKLKN